MFDKNFNAEAAIKKWAEVILGIGKIFMGLCGLAAFIVLCVNAEYLWWVALTILGGGALTLLTTSFSSVMIWGFGDIVGNTKRNANESTSKTTKNDEFELPEL